MAKSGPGAGVPQWGFSAIRDAVDTVLSRSGDTDTRMSNVELLTLCNYMMTSLVALGQSLTAHALGYLAEGEGEKAARCAAMASRFMVAATSGVQDLYTRIATRPPAAARQMLVEQLPALLERLLAIWNELGTL